MMQPVVIYEDNHLLVINKPAGLTTQGAAPGEPSVVEWARDYLKHRYDKPGNVYIGVVSRLDRDVSGVLLLARTSKAAARLNDQFRERTVEKTYWAVIEGRPPSTFECEDWLAPDPAGARMQVLDRDTAGAQSARLSGRLLAEVAGGRLVELNLETGRKHQIRVQLASRGWNVVGDRKYGGTRKFAAGIALHCRRLSATHPTRGDRLTFEAPPPKAWRELGVDR